MTTSRKSFDVMTLRKDRCYQCVEEEGMTGTPVDKCDICGYDDKLCFIDK